MRANRQTEEEVISAVETFLDHLAERRAEEALACFAPDADAALYGSEVGEVVVGPEALRAFLKRLLSRAIGPRFRIKRRSVSTAGAVAWLVADAEVEHGAIRLAPYRLTGVLEKRNGQWLWLLFNGSEPLPDRT